MPACVYCGRDAGEYDEHDECVERALEVALDVDEQALAAELELEPETVSSKNFRPHGYAGRSHKTPAHARGSRRGQNPH